MRRAAALVLALWCGIAAVRTLQTPFEPDYTEMMDARYAPLRRALPPDGGVAYRSDAPDPKTGFQWKWRYGMAQYALSPRVLYPDVDPVPSGVRVLVSDFEDHLEIIPWQPDSSE